MGTGSATGVRAVLWDADGVLQHGPAGWRAALDAVEGPAFSEAVLAAEAPALRGELPLRDALRQVLRAWPQAVADVDALLRLWEQAAVDPEAMLVVDQVRASGVSCALATNQHDVRRAWMRDTLRLDAHFDTVYYSCELGTVKPEPAFFGHVLADLGLRPAEVGFVDDSPANVEGARAAGLRAVRHDHAMTPRAARPACGPRSTLWSGAHRLPSAGGTPAARG